MKWLAFGLLLLLLLAQYRLWLSTEGSIAELHRLEQEMEQQAVRNRALEARNAQLEQEVIELQRGLETVEERARRDLGMIREGETYYQVVQDADKDKDKGEGDNDGG
jgi:cell division protein FtsB